MWIRKSFSNKNENWPIVPVPYAEVNTNCTESLLEKSICTGDQRVFPITIAIVNEDSLEMAKATVDFMAQKKLEFNHYTYFTLQDETDSDENILETFNPVEVKDRLSQGFSLSSLFSSEPQESRYLLELYMVFS